MYNLILITLTSFLLSISSNAPNRLIDLRSESLCNEYSHRQSISTPASLTELLTLLKKTNPELHIKKGKQVNGRTLYYANANFKTVVQLYAVQDSLKLLNLSIIMDAKDQQTNLRIKKINNIISKIAVEKVQSWVNDELKKIQKTPEKNQKYQLRTSKYAAYEINYEARSKQLSFNLYQ